MNWLDLHHTPAPPRPQPGAGTLLRSSAEGYAISAVPPRKGISGKLRFVPSLLEGAILLSRGLVNGVEPVAGGPKSTARMSKTAIRIDSSKANAAGESWLAVEVEAGELGIITKASRIEVIHTDDPNAFTPTVGRWPLTLIVWDGKRPSLVDQVTHWNLQYHRIQESATFARHAFL
jgi:hypothetical protein